ncbi:MAG: sensor histidine kinase [Desulfatirhabdiaceae bacterium]
MPESADWTIVLIDDEADIREVMTMSLQDSGYRVLDASNGESGIRLCHQEKPEIVITDIRMPGVDGIQVLETIKTSLPDTEVIVATAFGDIDLAIRALQLDASDFITKPISDEALFLALKRAQQRYTSRKKLLDYTALLEQQVVNQARILHQDKLMSMGRLAASVVHEINNPLSGILNYIRLMIRMLGKGQPIEFHKDKFLQYLEVVERETARCSGIVSNLLTFSRRTEPVVRPVNIPDLIDRSVMLIRHKLDISHIRLTVSVTPDIPVVNGDMNQLQQCILNLILNAIDAMPDGGSLTIRAGMGPDNAGVTIQIQDTGTGIAESDLPHIFEPFFSTKEAGFGVGLGLSTVFGIMERHGGRVDVISRAGQGATFTLWLPMSAG